MINDKLDELARLANAATPGPWRRIYGGLGVLSDHFGASEFVCRVQAVTPVEDAAFIAAARTAVPALIAEIRALRHVADIASDVLRLKVHFGDAPVRRIQGALADAIEAAQKVRVK